MLRLRHPMIAALHDLFMAASSMILAYYLRVGMDFSITSPVIYPGVAIFTATCVIIFSSFKLYRGRWRYASIDDLIALTKAVTLAVICFTLIMFSYNRLEGIPRSLPFINWLLLIAMLGGPRLFYRMLKDKSLISTATNQGNPIPVLLMGCNDNSDSFIRSTKRGHITEYEVVGILDNDETNKGRKIHGITIFGNQHSLKTTLTKLALKGKIPQKILLTNHFMAGSEVQSLLKASEQLGLSLARLPRLSDVHTELGETITLRPIVISDLLKRPQAVLNRSQMGLFIRGKSILITGAGGSIGSELTRQIAAFSPKRIILADLSEYNLYAIDLEIKKRFPDVALHSQIIDIRDYDQCHHLLQHHTPEIIFHAAALKHVPLVEDNIAIALDTNVLGTKNIADLAIAHNVAHMVFISTDKAVNPTNIMGASKRLAEKYLQSQENDTTQFTILRFGNVLGSSGSVVPLFQQQIEQGGPITITHPDITRYFMTIREAVELVIQAAALHAANQEYKKATTIFVLDMGKPVLIADLAKQMVQMAGLRLDQDIKITYTGLRPGEKLHEELFYERETLQKTSSDRIFYSIASLEHPERFNQALVALIAAINHYDDTAILPLLCKLVAEYNPQTLEENPC